MSQALKLSVTIIFAVFFAVLAHPTGGIARQIHQADGQAIPRAGRCVGAGNRREGTRIPPYAQMPNHVTELQQAGRYNQAACWAGQYAEETKARYGADGLQYAWAIKGWAGLLQNINRLADAEKLYHSALKIFEKVRGPEHPDVALVLDDLGVMLMSANRPAEAEPLMRRALTIGENSLRPDHPNIAARLNNLAQLVAGEGRLAEAEPLYLRALSIDEKNLGPDHRDVASDLNNLADLLWRTGRPTEAMEKMRRAVSIEEKTVGPNHPAYAFRLHNLAEMLRRAKHLTEAESFFRRSIDINEKSLGPDHPNVASDLNSLALILQETNQRTEAEKLFRRVVSIGQKSFGPDHPEVAIHLNNLALLLAEQGDWPGALSEFRKASEINARQREALGSDRYNFGLHVLAIHNASATQPERQEESFRVAQWALQTDAAEALSQMAARFAGRKSNTARESGLSNLVRQQQDLLRELKEADSSVLEAVGAADTRATQERRQVYSKIEDRLNAVATRLNSEFPDYAALANPQPLSISATRALLSEHEVLIQFLDVPSFSALPEENFIWLVTRKESRWVRSELGTSSLWRLVSALRCGLDEKEWSTATEAVRCGELLGLAENPDSSRPLPFDLGKAHELYQALFGQVEDLIKDKHLIIVPSGPLTSLPFHVLVTKQAETTLPPTFEGYRNVAWLGRSHALSILPAVSSLKALRVDAAKGAQAPKDYVGYGNPVLKGEGRSCRTTKVTDADQCPAVATQPVIGADESGRATIRGSGGGHRSGKLDEVFANGATTEAVLARVHALCPLPDTAYEVRCVSDRFKPSARLIRLGADATKEDIKALSGNGTLARYRIVHFATHGLVSGDIETTAKREGEPALVLTPPDRPKDADDNGLLTVSEVAQLKLNADWVVLSACNTAAGDKLGGEALSGLARAFFYAGAKALLVSHSPVYSAAAVQLTTAAFAELDRDPAAGRAQALQRAMINLMDDTSQVDNAHPAVWAPFVIVGEGGSGG